MGNEFMLEKSNDFKFNPSDPGQNTILHNYIRDFYINKFKFAGIYDGPKFEKGKNPNEMIAPMLADNKQYKKNVALDDSILSYSRKRACCLNKEIIPLSLPSYDKENKKVVTSTLQFPIFSKAELTDPNTCKDEDGVNIRPTIPEGGKHPAAGSKCSIFYKDTCGYIYKDRQQNYTLTDVYKGPYVNPAPTVVDRTSNKYAVINPFVDCGCLNSPFMKGVKAKGAEFSGNPDQVTQSVGTDCAPYMSTNRVFYNTYEKLDKLCITSLDLSDSKLTAVNGNILIDAKSNCGGAGTEITATDKTTKEREEKEAKEKADKEAKDKAEKEAKDKADKEAKDKADKDAAAKAAAASGGGSGSSGSGSSGSGSSGSGSSGSGSSGSGSSGSGSSGSGSSGSGSSGSGSSGSGSSGSGSSGSGSSGSGSSGTGSSGSAGSNNTSGGSTGSNNTSGGSTAPPEAPKSFLNSEMIKGVPNLYLIAGIVIILIILVFMFSGKGSNNRPSNYDNYE
jgi:hypothetical protein